MKTESDVEQKFVLPLLTQHTPLGLGFRISDFRTKHDIRQLKIDKGNKARIYFPDYLIVLDGLPLLVIEAKAPGVDLQEAMREARLYCGEINAAYSNGLNPCHKIIATNGGQTSACHWDSADEVTAFAFENADPASPSFHEFVNFCMRDAISNAAAIMLRKVQGDMKHYKPVILVGGASVQQATVPGNSFGSNLSIEYRYLFNPETPEERNLIARNAYVASQRRLSHVTPIDKVIRATIPESIKAALTFETTEKPSELIDALNEFKRIKQQVLLLVGSVGSGKSTFLDYFREMALDPALKSSLFWISVNMNNAPTSRVDIYPWILKAAIDQIKANDFGLDPFELTTLRKIFKQEITDFEKGAVSLFGSDSEHYKTELFKLINGLQGNHHEYVRALIGYLFVAYRRSTLFVLDNVDKRDRDTQLLFFEVANWLKSNFQCTVFLPIRDKTYDQFRSEPPLDTVVKDFIFRIDPPSLEKVLYARFQYAVREIEKDQSNFHYVLSNGVRVLCQRSEVINYLSCILKALFQNSFFKRLIVGLSDRDLRRGLEIFLDFCKSGNIREDEIFRMRFTNKQAFELPNHLVTQILFRGNRRYYSDAAAHVKSLFSSEYGNRPPDPLVRLSVLWWLQSKRRTLGPARIKGYHRIGDLIRDLMTMGHGELRVMEALEALASAKCLIMDSQSQTIDNQSLVSITATGIVHLDLVNHAVYLATVAEDVWFTSHESADQIRENMVRAHPGKPLEPDVVDYHCYLLLDALDANANALSNPSIFLEPSGGTGIFHIREKLADIRNHLEQNPGFDDFSRALKKYPPRSQHNGKVVTLRPYGVFVEFAQDANGFAHISDCGGRILNVGDLVRIEVKTYTTSHRRFKIGLL